jgi:hypothetical protein
MGYLVLPITGLPFALVRLAPVQVQAGGWFWAEAAGAFAPVCASLGLGLCLLVPRQCLLNCAYLTRFAEDAQGAEFLHCCATLLSIFFY